MNRKLRLKILERFDHQVDFAIRLGVDPALVSRVIRGRQTLNPQAQKQWARALGVKPPEVFGDH